MTGNNGLEGLGWVKTGHNGLGQVKTGKVKNGQNGSRQVQWFRTSKNRTGQEGSEQISHSNNNKIRSSTQLGFDLLIISSVEIRKTLNKLRLKLCQAQVQFSLS